MTPRNLLLYRYIILNACGFAFLVWAWSLGYVRQVFEGDVSHISYVIAALFSAGLASTTWRVLQVNAAVNALPDGKLWQRAHMAAQDRAATFSIKNAHIGLVSEWLVTLGLIGNVVGFVLALRGIDISAISSADGTQKVGAQLLAGMGVAFYSTLVGAVLAMWTSINHQMLKTATDLHCESLK